MVLPVRLYKYESFTTQSLVNLKSQTIYFGSPLNFNDPYDSALRVSINDPSNESVERIRQHHIKTFSKAQAELAPLNTTELKQFFISAGLNCIEKATEEFLRTKGVSCFSEKNDDLLMWAHYGGRYKGFCLEFSTEYETFQKARKVDYVPKPPTVELENILIDQSFDLLIQKLFCTKSDAWEYEEEWRIIHKEAGTQYGYPAGCLTGIYLGPDIDRQSLEIICLILKGQNEDVKFWQGKRSHSEFRIEFEAFDYTSHLEAKKLGLL